MNGRRLHMQPFTIAEADRAVHRHIDETPSDAATRR